MERDNDADGPLDPVAPALDLEELLSLTAHELHEPLRKITEFGGLLRARSGAVLDAESLDYLARMERAASRMRTTLGHVLAFSRVPRGLPFVTIDLTESVGAAANKLRDALRDTESTLTVDPLPLIEGDPFQMQQLFEQLLDNSIKFRRPGVPLHVHVQIDPSTTDLTHVVCVTDNGKGFDSAYAERIFRPFERLHGRSEHPGSGMGLAICRKIAERHGGALVARGTANEGAAFFLRVPRAKPKQRGISADE